MKNPQGTVERFRQWFVKVLFNDFNRTGDVSKQTWDAMALWNDAAEMCNNLSVTHRQRALFKGGRPYISVQCRARTCTSATSSSAGSALGHRGFAPRNKEHCADALSWGTRRR